MKLTRLVYDLCLIYSSYVFLLAIVFFLSFLIFVEGRGGKLTLINFTKIFVNASLFFSKKTCLNILLIVANHKESANK